ncbi:thiamine ABC transporter substrate-binding protein [Actinophytocola algeriensis]|uniref:Thiamine transport system substrate-binding protein n=1 Tax=Actinophytocola algeriensis TaxID=1768010 RepID=A0A7W7VJ40_9PSEU|nr:thiamine ABC transporter substrate-binding protein [Actinophytocola algeriensis]MBB4911954.1 thiamine transport system substrate-binding protein [Actinophytocola algeriensis]MBE1477554.1 thiamine transport system substrate-binding protein [Actinophytocola algeriensis]
MRLRTFLLVGALGVTLAGCSLSSGGDSGGGQGERKVVLVTHDSFAMGDDVLKKFTDDTGITIDVRRVGDAGALTNQLVLTKGSPIGDVAYGVDTTFASRALDEDVFAEYAPDAPLPAGPADHAIDDTNRLTAVDIGDVCLNIDPAALAAKGVPEPTGYADLAKPEYKDLLVVEDPATSSPGLAYLLGTIAQLGDGWQDHWRALKANGVQVVSGWEEAYTQEFSGSSGKGPRPIVVSYASSPSAELDEAGNPRTKAVLGTCFRQVEYAGVLKGAAHADDAEKVMDFLLSDEFQSQVPEQMYVYPARAGVTLPEAWQKAAPLPTAAAELPSEQIQQNRERWIGEWRAIVRG